ncbi:glycosyltransferase family 2 protein [Enterococcus malodoratus]|uniref:glycosyltransferase family 2 protein n=1 Tax=Enterococcus malodoratus TaxID=71451 RepID=UPI0020730538|nr:glycosyltransferase family 2 protein [Enterococcus malodoratus]
MTDLISIIVPVYNVEKYLSRCIESIINQTYKNIEILLVDDGSTDSCLRICEKYEKVDSRISVLKKNNGGLSSARNFGFKNSNGIFIVYIDSDDYVSETYISNLYSTILEMDVDIAISNFFLVNENGEKLIEYRNSTKKVEILDSKTALKELFIQKKFDTSAWGKMYKRHFFDKYEYPEGKLFEDLPTTYKLFLDCENIGYVNSRDYYYVQRADSIVNMEFNIKKLDLLENVDSLFQEVSDIEPDLKKYAGTRAFASLMNLWKSIPKSSKYKQVVWKSIKKYRKYPLLVFESKAKLKFGSIISVFGSGFSSIMIKLRE